MATSLYLGRESSGRARLARRLAADPRFVVEDLEPCYRRLTAAELAAKVESAHRELVECRACPRDCGVNRMHAGLSDPASLRYVAQVLGDAEVETRSHSLPEALGRASTQLSTTRTALAPAHALCQMQPGDGLLVHGTLPPAHVRAHPYYTTAASPTAPPSHPPPPLLAARHPHAMTRSRRRSPAASSCAS
jgi:hypothetical protein